MYKAKIDIGEFKKGQIVPDEIAAVWKEMYLESPVEEIKKESEPKTEIKKKSFRTK